MKTILHLRSSGGMLGPERVILEICNHSKKHNYTHIIGIITTTGQPYPPFAQEADKAGIPCILFEGKGQIDFRCSAKINEVIKKRDIALVHTHGYKEDFYSLFIPRSVKRLATSHLWKMQDFRDSLYCHLDAFFLCFRDTVIGISDETVYEMHRKGIKKAYKIANGIDPEHFRPTTPSTALKASLGIASADIVLGMISSLSHEKGHAIALQALSIIRRSHPNIMLLIAGVGRHKDHIVQEVTTRGLEKNVSFVGARSDIVDMHALVDIFLLPSLREGLPMALLEAMACGKCCIATTVGEVPQLISSHKNGILIPHSDSQALADALLNLLDNPGKREQLGNEARRRISEAYSSPVMASAYCKAYDKLLDKSN